MVGKVKSLTVRRSQRLAAKLYSCDGDTQTRTSNKVMSRKLCTGILTVFNPTTTRISLKRKSGDDNVQDEIDGMMRKKFRPATTCVNGPRRSPRLQNGKLKRTELVTPSNPKIICCTEVRKPPCKNISRETANSEQKKVTSSCVENGNGLADTIKKIQKGNRILRVRISKLEKELAETIRNSKNCEELVAPFLQPIGLIKQLDQHKSPPPSMKDLPVKSRKVRRQPIQPTMSSRVLRSHCANRCLESREADVFDGGAVVEIDNELELISQLPNGDDIDIDESENEDGDDSESHDKLPKTYIKANRILDKYLLTHLKGHRTNEKVNLASQTIAPLIVSESRLWIQKYLNREFRFLLSRAHERLVPLWIIEAFFGSFVEGAKEFTSHFKTNTLTKYIAEAFENYKMEHSDSDDISSLWVKCLKEMEFARARVIKTTRGSEKKQELSELNK